MWDNTYYLQSCPWIRSSFINLDSFMFWNCVPTTLNNFIRILTMNENKFSKLKKKHVFFMYYLIMFLSILKRFSKFIFQLVFNSLSYDIINTMNERFITSKHYLLSNELFRHERLFLLLPVTNRLSHTYSDLTIRWL